MEVMALHAILNSFLKEFLENGVVSWCPFPTFTGFQAKRTQKDGIGPDGVAPDGLTLPIQSMRTIESRMKTRHF